MAAFDVSPIVANQLREEGLNMTEPLKATDPSMFILHQI